MCGKGWLYSIAMLCAGASLALAGCTTSAVSGGGSPFSAGECTDPTDEVCDGIDNDCDGLIDEGFAAGCGNCGVDCLNVAQGVGGPNGWPNPDTSDSSEYDGVVIDPQTSSLVLDENTLTGEQHPLIWIANTAQGTVSKIDTNTFTELARYRVGSGGAGDDPSRTSVNAFGDVYVGNRKGLSVTKISSRGDACPDTNGDGKITTSSGPTDILDWGKDDCVLWQRGLSDGGLIRAVAAQDALENGEVKSYVWIGGYNKIAWKLDGETGDILLRTASPTNNYGFALDGRGNLWSSGRGDNALGRIDTSRCIDDASCNVSVCAGIAGDDCMKQSIPLGVDPYGITVDVDQRVWVAGLSAQSIVRYVFNKSLALADRITVQNVGAGIHGIAADGAGWLWGSAKGVGVLRVDTRDMSRYQVVTGTAGEPSKGMAVDFDGKIWSINQSDNATVIEAGATLKDAKVTNAAVTGLVTPYTYSDMTGQQLRLATGGSGIFRQLFPGCEVGETIWHLLVWDAVVPAGTGVRWRVRTAPTRDAVASAPWVDVGEAPPVTSPVDLVSLLADNGVKHEFWLEVEVQLYSTPDHEDETPRVKEFGVTQDICRAPPS